ncbi:MAG: GTPase Era [Miltoncostaeaceae bacterium]
MVVLAGRPNVGKSTLANALAGHRLAAVSPRPQTTRRRIHAVVEGDGWQAVLADLPGFQRPGDLLTERMQARVDAEVADAEAVLFLTNAAEAVGPGDRFIARRLADLDAPVMLVVNQVDRVDPGAIGAHISEAAALVGDPVAVHPVSALTGDGLDALRADLPSLLQEGPRLFPEGMPTDQTFPELAEELVREAALARLRQELPHAMAVEVEDIEEAAEGLIIRAGIVVETDSQKGIVVGKGGRMVRDIGSDARRALGEVLGTEVHLDLMVRVKRRWRDDPTQLDRLGL